MSSSDGDGDGNGDGDGEGEGEGEGGREVGREGREDSRFACLVSYAMYVKM